MTAQTRPITRTLIHALFTSLALLLVAACVAQSPTPPASTVSTTSADTLPFAGATLTVATHDSFAASEEVIAAFEAQTGATLQFLPLGDAGSAVNKMILSQNAPLADVFYGTDNTFLSRALSVEIFTPYASPLLAEIPEDLKLDPENRLLPVDVGYININADAAWFTANNLPLPASLADLIDPAYKDLLVLPNPATSSPGLAFLLASIGQLGADGWQAWWQALRANGVLIAEDWTSAYYNHFTVGSSGAGDRPLVVSYSSSPPADVLFATDGRTQPGSVNLNLDGGVFRQIEFVGIVKRTQQLALAQAWVDFMLGTQFQEDIPLQMFVYPVNQNAALPDLFVQFAEPPTNATSPDPAAIDANREAWISEWTEIMLR